MWTAYALVVLIAAASCAVALWRLGRVAPALGLVDHPRGRKRHGRATPLVGGLAVVLAVFAALALAAAADSRTAAALSAIADRSGLLLGVAVLALVGALDDRRPIKARYKLGFQLACSMCAVGLDQVVVTEAAGVGLGAFARPFTIMVMLTVVNGLNMLDGVDGLAGGLSLVGLLFMALAAAAGGLAGESALLFAFVGALAAFLAVNFPVRSSSQASAFLGDAGSLVLGFVLAYFAVGLSGSPDRMFSPSVALWFFFVPVADTVLLYLRRNARDGAPFSPGRDHVHHILMRRWSARTVCWLLIVAGAGMAGLSLLAERAGLPPAGQAATWGLAFLLYARATRRPWTAAWLRSRRAERRAAAQPQAVRARAA
ncbi:MraY family glycosyltransferase [Caulobacter sp. 17J80-11]|uniref:MraY family glycosyltransferase n=1 Tax=Caulobacter sp. 17J80-11 TaxID=2763502 RepID=UPI0016539AED|nr:MraY family glycosyltransferase [Caulobacter sp. 17J80-11]MBC6983387.1 undecaprenyl/decaprenyl-phosphate alpha-N-acetylglucosaminyl 1-phosphate transferase [Caulobacter sp. 17J80-11]